MLNPLQQSLKELKEAEIVDMSIPAGLVRIEDVEEILQNFEVKMINNGNTINGSFTEFPSKTATIRVGDDQYEENAAGISQECQQ
jgi:hypothetical protein